jgi:hypothetical protein
MSKLTQEQLERQIRKLKEIKPRAEWVILAKSQIFNETTAKEAIIENPVRKISFFDIIKAIKTQRKMAYSVATLSFVIIGLVGFAQNTTPGDLLFSVKKITEQSQASLIGQTGVRKEIATLNNRINDLAQVAMQGKTSNMPSAINEVNIKASALTKTLKETPVEDVEIIKEITDSLQVLAYMPGTDLSESQDIKELYKEVVQMQIVSFKKSTLTEEQEEILLEIEELNENEKYIEALEKILSMNVVEENITEEKIEETEEVENEEVKTEDVFEEEEVVEQEELQK